MDNNFYRSDNTKKENPKFDFIKRKDNTIKSLKDVDFFLNKLNKGFNYLNFFKFFK